VGAFFAIGIGAFLTGTVPAAFGGSFAAELDSFAGVDAFAGVLCGLTGGGTGFLAGVGVLGRGTGFFVGRADISVIERIRESSRKRKQRGLKSSDTSPTILWGTSISSVAEMNTNSRRARS